MVAALLIAVFGVGAGAGAAVWAALDSDDIATPDGSSHSLAPDPDTASSPTLPDAQLTVASDGCGVIRSELDVEPRGLQWSVTDQDGFEVLGRNALGETRYRYYQSGTFTVTLVAWDGDRYVPISNTVTIRC